MGDMATAQSSQHSLPNGVANGVAVASSEEDDIDSHEQAAGAGLGPRPTPAERAAREAESDRISAALGAKLLAGWAMLASYCPRCV